MSTVDYLQSIVTHFRVILDEHDRHLELFYKHATQVEGWLKGELLPFFDREMTDGRLVSFDTEVNCGHGRVDYRLIVPDGIVTKEIWIELKHFHIGMQKGSRWKASNYFPDKTIGIYSDVDKLSKIATGDKFILVLTTKNPEYEETGDWSKGVDRFNQKFPPLQIKSLTDPSVFPRSYFLGLLEVIGKY
ncbi:hypothetical protein ACFLTJ_02850 [Chloroflexota bacterium]